MDANIETTIVNTDNKDHSQSPRNKQGSEEKKKRKKVIVGIIIAILLLLLSIVVLHRMGFIRFPWETGRIVVGNVQQGALPGLSDEELLAEMQRQADESNVTVQLNSIPVFETGESKGWIHVKNLDT